MEPLPVVLATLNRGKAREFGRLLEGALAVEALPPRIGLPEETGETFAENARLKAEAAFTALSGASAVLADDSGLEVEALGGRPGIRSARFAGPAATDAENVAKLLHELEGHSERKARFACCLCLVLPAYLAGASSGDTQPYRIEVQGVIEGTITSAPRGDDGFGYDPVFRPDGWGMTLAEAEPSDKDGVSHRGAAARALLIELRLRGLVDHGA